MLANKFAAFCLLFVAVSSSLPASSATSIVPIADTLTYPISHELTIHVALIGFSDSRVNLDSLRRFLPSSTTPLLQMNSLSYGASFTLRYSLTAASETTSQRLRAFVQSAVAVKNSSAYLQQFFPSVDTSQYAIIPADRLESGLRDCCGELDLADSHYTVLVANLTGVSNHDHYYEAVYEERDSAFQTARLGYSVLHSPTISWLISWGGPSRLYFLDLSAGSKNSTRDYALRKSPHIPIQYFLAKYPGAHGDTISKYIADYVSEAIHELIVQDYSRVPPLSENYHIKVFLIDDTGRIFESNYARFLNASLIQGALRDLIPYANFTIELHLIQLQVDEGLNRRIKDSMIMQANEIGFGLTGLVVRYYDTYAVYSYLRSRLDSYVGEDFTQTIPIFALALRSAGQLVDVYEGTPTGTAADSSDPEMGTPVIFAYPELGLVSLNEYQLFDWGTGFTHCITQTAGYMLGLMQEERPGKFSMRDAQSSVVSYQTNAFGFSRFDKDAIHRAHVDYVLSLDKQQLDETGSLSLQGLQDVDAGLLRDNASKIVKLGEQAYDSLDFESALARCKEAYFVIDRLFESHTQWLTEAIDSLERDATPATQESLRLARSEVIKAMAARDGGDLATSFRLLTRASISVAIGANIEQTLNTSRITNIILGLLVGIAIGAGLNGFVAFVQANVLRSRKKAEGRKVG